MGRMFCPEMGISHAASRTLGLSYLAPTKPLYLLFNPVSSPGEFHPQALVEPDVNLSIHPAPIIRLLERAPTTLS